jgi:hypothetical protein
LDRITCITFIVSLQGAELYDVSGVSKIIRHGLKPIKVGRIKSQMSCMSVSFKQEDWFSAYHLRRLIILTIDLVILLSWVLSLSTITSALSGQRKVGELTCWQAGLGERR